MKNTFYLSFGIDALRTPPLISVKRKLGHEGIGIFLDLAMRLAESENYQLPIAELENIAFDLHADPEKTKSLVFDFDAFQINGDFFCCKMVNESFAALEEFRKKRSEAGQRGNIVRWGNKADKQAQKSADQESDVSLTDRSAIAQRSQTVASHRSNRIVSDRIVFNLNKEKEKIDKKERVEKTFNSLEYIKNLDLDPEVKENLLALAESRKDKRSAMTQKAVDLMVKELNKHDKQTQIKALQASVMNGWKGIYIKSDQKPNWRPPVDPTQLQPGEPNKFAAVVGAKANW